VVVHKLHVLVVAVYPFWLFHSYVYGYNCMFPEVHCLCILSVDDIEDASKLQHNDECPIRIYY
jgi:hypothetical protein